MNREKLMRMAVEAGGFNELRPLIEREYWVFPCIDDVEAFAGMVSGYMVQAAINVQREKVAQWMLANGYATGHGEKITDLLEELKWQIEEKIAIEREACAKVCDELVLEHPGRADLTAKQCAFAIRERGAP